MDKEKVIKGLKCLAQKQAPTANPCKNCGYSGRENFAVCVKDIAYDAIVLLKEHEWNLLREDADGIIHGLPGDDGTYLMTDGKEIWIDDYVDGVSDGIILDSGRDVRDIKAWMDLPKLPKNDRR